MKRGNIFMFFMGGFLSIFCACFSIYAGYQYSRMDIVTYYLNNKMLVYPRDNIFYNMPGKDFSEMLVLINEGKFEKAKEKIYALLPCLKKDALTRFEKADKIDKEKILDALKMMEKTVAFNMVPVINSRNK